MTRLFPSLLAAEAHRIVIQNLEKEVRESHFEVEEFRNSVYSIISMLDEMRNIDSERGV